MHGAGPERMQAVTVMCASLAWRHSNNVASCWSRCVNMVGLFHLDFILVLAVRLVLG